VPGIFSKLRKMNSISSLSHSEKMFAEVAFIETPSLAWLLGRLAVQKVKKPGGKGKPLVRRDFIVEGELPDTHQPGAGGACSSLAI